MRRVTKNIGKCIMLMAVLSLLACNQDNKEGLQTGIALAKAQKHYLNMLSELDNATTNPRTTEKDGELRLVASRDWTSGFFPGGLWYLYESTGDETFKTSAEHYSNNIIDQQYNGKTHDMGFKMYCSYGNGYRLTNNPEYKKVLIQSANTLITRYNPTVGCIKSWDHNLDKWPYSVIIDNMMNLELLFWATRATGDSIYYDIAVSHATTTMNNHFRPDNSCYHVLGYDVNTGEVLKKNTHQGYSHESAWVRGQAWGLYGFTMCYRETGDQAYLYQAEKIAAYVLQHPNMPEDYVPYWDFDDPDIPNAPRDASAAAVLCSGLYELSTYSDNQDEYLKAADKILGSLSSDRYFASLGTNNNFILKHSVGNMPKNDEIDEPIVYADYYYLEALLRKINLDK